MNLSFTMTATLRPDILDQTIFSFVKHLKDIELSECEIFANIDPVPRNMIDKKQATADVLSRYFKKVHLNTPENANFASAVKWAWSTASSPFIFHLEDDWVLTEDVMIEKLLDMMSQNKSLYQIRLCKFLKKSATKKYGLSPCLIRHNFYSVVGREMNTSVNPEWQLREAEKWGLLSPKYEVTVCEYPKGRIIIKDIGRRWRVKNHMSKHETCSEFLEWKWKNKVARDNRGRVI